MSSLETRKIEPQSSTTVTLGEAGDTVAVPAGAIVKTNTVKDSGGNTLFTSDGAGTFSSVNSAIPGSLNFISSQTASSSASISFTSGIDSTYDEYVFYFVSINPATSLADFSFQTSTNAGSSYGVTVTTTYFRAYHTESNSAYAFGYDNSRDLQQSTSYQQLMSDLTTDADSASVGELHLFAPSSTTYVKQFYAVTSCSHSSSGVAAARNIFIAGYFNTTSAIDAINFKMDSGNLTAGTIYLYGIS